MNQSFQVTQKMHHTAHQTWEEIQIVILLSLWVSGVGLWSVQDLRILRWLTFHFWSSLRCRWNIRTVSIIFPSASSKRNLVVSGPSTISLRVKSLITKCSLSVDLRSFESVLSSSISRSDSLYTHCKICFWRKAGIHCSLRKELSASVSNK